MKNRLRVTALCVGSAVALVGCARPKLTSRPPICARRAIDPRAGLHVAFVANNDYNSGTPVARDMLVAAAHCFDDTGPLAAVDGYPVQARHHSEVRPNSARDVRDDWMILESARNRFVPNNIDPTIALEADQRVYVAGYRAADLPADLTRMIEFPPRLVEGRVMDAAFSSDCPDGVVPIRVANGDYMGFSGGPAAVVDDSGNVRVFGLIARLYYRREWRPPWRRYIELWAVRLPPTTALRAQRVPFRRPTPACRTRITRRPQRRCVPIAPIASGPLSP